MTPQKVYGCSEFKKMSQKYFDFEINKNFKIPNKLYKTTRKGLTKTPIKIIYGYNIFLWLFLSTDPCF